MGIRSKGCQAFLCIIGKGFSMFVLVWNSDGIDAMPGRPYNTA